MKKKTENLLGSAARLEEPGNKRDDIGLHNGISGGQIGAHPLQFICLLKEEEEEKKNESKRKEKRRMKNEERRTKKR